GGSGEVLPAPAVDAVAPTGDLGAVIAPGIGPGERDLLVLGRGGDIDRGGSRWAVGAEGVGGLGPVAEVGVTGPYLEAIVLSVVGHGDFLARGQRLHAAATDAVLVPFDLLPVIGRRVVGDLGGVVLAGGFDTDITHAPGFTEGAHLIRFGRNFRIPGTVGGHQGEGVVVGVLHLHFPGSGATTGGEGL